MLSIAGGAQNRIEQDDFPGKESNQLVIQRSRNRIGSAKTFVSDTNHRFQIGLDRSVRAPVHLTTEIESCAQRFIGFGIRYSRRTSA